MAMTTKHGGTAARQRPTKVGRLRDSLRQKRVGELMQLSSSDVATLSFREIADSIPHIVWLAGPDGSTQYFNRRGSEYTGVGREANYDWRWTSAVHPDDAERAQSSWAHAVKTHVRYAGEHRVRRADGAFRWHEFRALPVLDREGGVAGWVGTATDIEDRERLQDDLRGAERQAAESLTLLETLQSTAPVGFGFVGREFRVQRINETLAATSGTAPAEQLAARWPSWCQTYGRSWSLSIGECWRRVRPCSTKKPRGQFPPHRGRPGPG
jgi:PAS domain S-box-containing protein